MIVGVGIDHVQVRRMKEILLKWAQRVEDRVFGEEELRYSHALGDSHLHLAARFAAKEAFFKAVGRGLADGMTWTDVVVVNDPAGKPEIVLRKRAREIADSMGVSRSHVSLTHTEDCAVAVVILES